MTDSTAYAKATRLRADCEADLDAMAKARAAETGEDYYDAYDAVCRTEEGERALKAHFDATRLQDEFRPAAIG